MQITVLTNRWLKRFQFNRYILSLVIIGGLIGSSGLIYLLALDKVSLKVDGQIYQWKTVGNTVAKVLQEKKISLNPGDVVTPDINTKIAENTDISVIRAFGVTIKKAEQTLQFATVALSVGQVLTNAGIAFDDNDKIVPGLDVIVQPDQQIKVIDVRTVIETKKVVLKATTEYRRDKVLERGVQKVLRTGKNGLAERQIKVVYEDGRETRRYQIAQKIVKPVISSIIALGIKPVVKVLETSRGSYRYLEMKQMNATAYSPGPESCGKYAVYGRTYTGKKAGFGIVAVDPRVIPLGTMLYIEGYGKAEAADIGGAIKGNRIDLCFETYREAVMFGRKKVKVYILESRK